jgi:hypothetical protein
VESQKHIVLKYKGLYRSRREVGRKNEGFPKNDGISIDVHENKGLIKMLPGMSVDVVENKQVMSSFWRCC